MIVNKFNIIKEITFPDHYNYTQDDIDKIKLVAKNLSAKIITTEKDFMKIPEQFKKDIDFLAIDLVIQDEKKLIELLTKWYEIFKVFFTIFIYKLFVNFF